ncbi:MAG: hypothetical protein F4137_10195 [Acidobacteria bacterium]|nr:hypothetical protein [Acidobacteriota bacterium]MYH29206.1 hypothetical protein [Acidobacteriota bacterium]
MSVTTSVPRAPEQVPSGSVDESPAILARRIEAQELMLAFVLRSIYPLVDRAQIANARRVIRLELPSQSPDDGGPDLKTMALEALDRIDQYLPHSESEDAG